MLNSKIISLVIERLLSFASEACNGFDCGIYVAVALSSENHHIAPRFQRYDCSAVTNHNYRQHEPILTIFSEKCL
jgi:hypothetical protein